MATLVMLQGGEAIPYDLGADDTVIGRHPECGIHLDSNMVSRRHAHVLKRDGQYIVEDLGSGNGTFVNGKRIEGPTALKHDDRVKLGPILLRFESERSEVKQAHESTSSFTLGATAPFKLDVASGESDSAKIVGESQSSAGYGALQVQPEAKLKGILEISRAMAGTVEMDQLLPKILDTLFNIFPQADRGSILFKDFDSGRMVPAAQKHRRPSEDSTVKLSKTILNKVLNEKAGILSADATSDSRFEAAASISDLTIHSMMCVPMLNLQGEAMGVINVDTQNPLNVFTKDDLDLLIAVAGQAAISYENARLLVSHLEKVKQDNEMQIARGVQRALLPEKFPVIDGYEFYASYESAQAVGGDYYDCIQLDDHKICLSFGDVAGKGVPGALIMSRMSSVVQNTMGFVHDVDKAIVAINNHMCDNAVEGRFVTYVLVVLDTSIHELSLVNAGHMSPMIRRIDGTVDVFPEETIGIPVGVVENYPFEVVRRTIAPGETVVIVTDGVDEAMNPAGQLYTKERVIQFVKNASPKAEALGKALLADVRKHAKGRPQNDDLTIMAFGRNAV